MPALEEEEEPEPQPLFPDSLETMDLNRPQLGQHQTHANTLMEQAAALGALRNGLMLSGFDNDESWVLVRMYARLWWSALHDREAEMDLEFDEDDD